MARERLVEDSDAVRRVPVPSRGGPGAALGRMALYTGVFLVAPNLLVVLLGAVVYLVRPPLNLDYALLAPAFALAGGGVTAGLYGVLVVVDLMRSALPAFHFSPRSAVEAALAVWALPPVVLGVAAAGGLLLVGGLGWGVYRGLRPLPASLPAAAAVVLLAGAAAVAEDRLQAPGPGGEAVLRSDVATSALGFLYHGIRAGAGGPAGGLAADVPAGTSPLFEALDAGEALPDRVVLVLVESLGLPSDTVVKALQWSALARPGLGARYEIVRDTVPFHGSTVPAELRELCRLGVSTVHPDPGELPVDECLTARLKERGYVTVAVHGFSGVFFRRSAWYPDLALDSVFLGPDAHRLTGSEERCGLVFLGACDGHVAEWLHGRLRAADDERVFIYWLTLNAHSPAPAPDPALTSLPCQSAGLEPELCRLLGHHDLVLGELVDVAMDPHLAPTLFVMVGDHAPPFGTAGVQGRFEPEHVPAVLLWPRESR